ncbi:MAG TPA: S9 family peptidase [Phycisphaerales bacterium]|nr:S9 family peptidase [Phycisphaerales bacterium]HMP37605.1 S9 family peptidase [Phycisphaerales bacterium]
MPSRRPIAVEDLLRLRIAADPQVSPDGSSVLFTLREATERPGHSRTRLMLARTHGASKGDGARPFTAGPRDSKGRWSPDGSTIAFIRAEPKHRPQIFLIDAAGGEARALTSFPEGSIDSFRWSPDGARLAVKYRQSDPTFGEEAQRRRSAAGESEPPRATEDVWYRLDGDGYFGPARYALHLVELATGRSRVLHDRDRLGDFTFDWSPDGRTIALTTNTSRRPLMQPWHDEILLIDVARGGASRPGQRRLRGLPDGPKTAIAWSPDGQAIAWAGRADRSEGLYSPENLRLFVAEVRGDRAASVRSLIGDPAEDDCCMMAAILSDSADASFAPALLWSRDSSRVFVKLGREGRGQLASIGRTGGPLVTHTREEGDRSLGNLDRSGTVMALIVSDFTTPPEVAIAALSPDGARVRRLTALNEALLNEVIVAAPESHEVKAADGHRSQLWIMRPPQRSRGSRKRGGAGRRTPAVLLVHGGPHAMYGETFFHEMQTLAARGWTVCFGNPRGSKGYGRDHCAAIRGAWGDRDWEDILGYVAAMKKDRRIDGKRLAIAGGSYGGYMAAWAIGHSHDFRCAIVDRCVSNLLSMAGNSDYPDIPDEYWPGAVWERWERRWESSPIRHIGTARTPTLVIHSEGDLRCNVEQGEQLFTALCTLRVPARLVRYPASTSHGMSRTGPPDLRRHRLGEMIAWLERHL